MRTIYLSPHLDDAVLSAGGLLSEWAAGGLRIEIWTLMAGFPGGQELSDFGRRMHAEWGTTTPDETVRLRRAEDRRAAAAIGAISRHFDFVDCLYRRDDRGTPLYEEALRMPIHPFDVPVPGQIRQVLAGELREDDRVLCQLGIGEHVDHLLVRTAAEMLDRQLTYVADVPYVLNHPEEVADRTTTLRGHIAPISESALEVWQHAIGEYRSQLTTLFLSLADMRARLQAYWAESRGIRLWVGG